jgi:hypothetical protein
MVVLTPVPVNIAPSGRRVSVHEPEDGRPDNNTVPVETLQPGWVIVPGTGAPGISGPVFMTTSADGPEVHPASFVTVKVNVPEGIPVIRALLPVPVVTTSPGVRVTLHVPAEGSPDN